MTPRLLLFLPWLAFVGVWLFQAERFRRLSSAPMEGWAATGLEHTGFWGLGPYLEAQEQYVGFSYALGAAFAVWSVGRFLRSRQAAMAAGAAGGVTLVGVLMAGGASSSGAAAPL